MNKKKTPEEQDVLKLEDLTQKNEDNTPNFLNDEGDSVSDKVSLMALNELLDIKKLKTISRVKFDQVLILTKLYLFSDTFKTPFRKQLADYMLQLQISVNGLGRKELVSLVQQRDMTLELNNDKNKVTSKNIFK